MCRSGVLFVLYVRFVPSVRCVINKVLEGLERGGGGGRCSVLYLGLDQSHVPLLSSHISSFFKRLEMFAVFLGRGCPK